jgi:hypothetical protein
MRFVLLTFSGLALVTFLAYTTPKTSQMNVVADAQLSIVGEPQREPKSSSDCIQVSVQRRPIKTSFAGQVIQSINLHVDSGDALQVRHHDVAIRNLRIHHKTGAGINIMSASNVVIENC